MEIKKKVWPIYRKEAANRKSPEESQTLDSLDKKFKSVI